MNIAKLFLIEKTEKHKIYNILGIKLALKEKNEKNHYLKLNHPNVGI